MLKTDSSKSLAIVIMGPQGSGKSTQTEFIAQRFHLPLFESGGQLRALAESDSPIAEQIRAQMHAGQLADNPTLWQLFEAYLKNHTIDRGHSFDAANS